MLPPLIPHAHPAREPPSLLEFRWGPDVIRLEIAARGEGEGCTLTLLDTFDELGKAARDAAGWHVCLEFLASHLDGTPEPPANMWTKGPSRLYELVRPGRSACRPSTSPPSTDHPWPRLE